MAYIKHIVNSNLVKKYILKKIIFFAIKMSSPSEIKKATDTVVKGEEQKGKLWAILTSIFLMWVFFYVVFQVFNPYIVQKGSGLRGPELACEKRDPDNGKCFVASFVVTLLLSLVMWLIVASMK